MKEFPPDQLAELKALFPGVSIGEEGDFTYFLIPSLRLPDGCQPEVVDALLCPLPRDGYESRLFYSQQINARVARNWHVQNLLILERKWFGFSWKTNREGLRLAQMVMEHLCALK